MALIIHPGKEVGVGIFGERLKAERIRRNMTVSYLAAAAGMHISQLTGAENRGVLPRLGSVIRLAIELDCTLDYLCGLENEDGARDIHPSYDDPKTEAAHSKAQRILARENSDLRRAAAGVDSQSV